MFLPAKFPGGPNFPHRIGLTWQGDLECTAPNPDYPRCPYRVTIDPRSGNVIESNMPLDSIMFRRMVKAARRHVIP